MSRPSDNFYSGDLFGELHHTDAEPAALRLSDYLPGMVVCGVASLAAAWLAEHYGFPIILLGLLIGLAMSFVSTIEATAAGLDFASRHFLRAGIVLLGLQVTFAQVAGLGWLAFGGLLIVMVSAFFSAILAARWVGEGQESGILAGGATAICGASAALALYGVIGRGRLGQARFSVALVGVALASAVAMSVYPAIAQATGMSDKQAGFLIGASVHDAAQAIGGAYSYSDAAGADATVVKLARVAMLGPIVALVALWLGRGEGGAGSAWRKVAMPWFIVGFFILLAFNSLISFPDAVTGPALALSKILLLLAVVATAMRSQLGLLVEAGWRALVPVGAASVVSFAVALAISWAAIA